MNLYPNREPATYTLLPDAQFFEFIKVSDADEDQPDTLLLHQLNKGEVYEVVISNGSGLYRYRLGDVVQVVEYFNELPVVKFLHRRGQILNVHGEKISEEIFYKSLHKCEESWNIRLRDYTTAESVLTDTGSVPHYTVFIETEEDKKVSPEDMSSLDAVLRADHPVYESFRAKGSINPINVVQVSCYGYPAGFSYYPMVSDSPFRWAVPNIRQFFFCF